MVRSKLRKSKEIRPQTYQEVYLQVQDEMPAFVRIEPQPNPQLYFWELKQKHPERFERLQYDTNGSEPYSSTLSSIIFDMMLCGTIYTVWNKIVLASEWNS